MIILRSSLGFLLLNRIWRCPLLKYLVKEAAESMLRNYRKFLVGARKNLITKSLTEDGIAIVPNFIAPEDCMRLCKKIDKLIESSSVNVWRDDIGSDERIYFVDQIDQEFQAIYENEIIRDVLKNYTGTEKPQGMLLAGKIEYKRGNVGSGGGWHRDSPITHQFKAIFYLNDVNESNGPFQYIKKSHKKRNSIYSCLDKIFNPGQYRYNDNEIADYLEYSNSSTMTFTGQAGTVAFADTKGIHRGKPLETGVRYALFCYFWHNEIPEHFSKLRQKVSNV